MSNAGGGKTQDAAYGASVLWALIVPVVVYRVYSRSSQEWKVVVRKKARWEARRVNHMKARFEHVVAFDRPGLRAAAWVFVLRHGRLSGLRALSTDFEKKSHFARVDCLSAKSEVGVKDIFWPRGGKAATRPLDHILAANGPGEMPSQMCSFV